MPSFDGARGRFRLASGHLGVLGCAYDGQVVPGELAGAREELRQAGLINDEGAVIEELVGLIGVLADPLLLVQVEITSGEGVTSNGAVIGSDSCYVYETWPGQEEAEYVPTDPALLVWSLARVVGLSRRESKPPQVAVITSTVGVMDAGFAALAGMAAETVEEAADQLSAALGAAAGPGGLTGPELTVFTHVLLQMNANWRMTAAWANPSGRGTDLRGIAVLDCGPLGYWLRERPAEPILPGAITPDSELRLVHVEAAHLWELITDLVPDRSELRITS